MDKTIKANDREITAKTLTVEQIADLMEKLDDKRTATLAEMLMDSSIPEDFVLASTGLPREWFTGSVTPDDIYKVWQAVEEVNGFLSRLLSRLSAAGKLLEQLGPPESEAPSAR